MAQLLDTVVTGVMNVSSTLNSAAYVTTDGQNVLGVANSAANTVRISANGGSTLSKQQLNFINTASLQVLVESGAGAAAGNANVSFTVVGGAQGPQGTTGTGTQGVQGTTGISGMRVLNFMIHGGGASISTGSTEAAQSKGYVATSEAMNVASWKIYANASGVIVVDVWTQSSTLTTPTLISGTNPPRLASAQQNSSAGITGWSSGVIAAGNVIQFRVNSSSTPTVETVTVALTMNP